MRIKRYNIYIDVCAESGEKKRMIVLLFGKFKITALLVSMNGIYRLTILNRIKNEDNPLKSTVEGKWVQDQYKSERTRKLTVQK